MGANVSNHSSGPDPFVPARCASLAASFLQTLELASNGKGPERAASLAGKRYRSLFLSDLHLGSRHCRADRILDFLRSNTADTLYLVGDVFHDGFALRRRWSPVYDAIFSKLADRAREGSRIVYLPGNHDQAFRQRYGVHLGGVEVVEQALHVTGDGKRLLVLHGDRFDPAALRALWLSRLGGRVDAALRSVNWAVNRAMRFFGFDEWSLMTAMTPFLNALLANSECFGRRVAECVRESGADGIVCGHSHRAAIHEDFGTLYANCGEWLDGCTAIGEEADGGLKIIRWKTAAIGPAPVDFESRARTPVMAGG
jgi:UDP-2,3-diacylglucosamine pyrophosphatase LpxH